MKPESKINSFPGNSEPGNEPKKQEECNLPTEPNAAELETELAPTLSHLNPEVRDQIETLEHSGHTRDAEDELLKYVLEEDHFESLRKAQKGAKSDEVRIHRNFYLLALIPTAIALRYLYELLTTGHISLP